jgi:Phage integrase family
VTGSLVLDAAGRRRSPATMPGFHTGRPPRNKGLRYPADPPAVEEIVAVMRIAGDGLHGCGAPVFASTKRSPCARPTSIAAAAHYLSGTAREGDVARSGWTTGDGRSSSRLIARVALPIGPLFCIINGRTRGRPWTTSGARAELRRVAARAGVRRRFAPHQLRHAHAVEMAREGVPLIVIQRQLGHGNLGITSVYLQGIDNAEIIETVHARRAPMIPVSASPHSY